ncbi:MAG: hypothetical protein U1F43_09110, partial [Myxococcota bacterium]
MVEAPRCAFPVVSCSELEGQPLGSVVECTATGGEADGGFTWTVAGPDSDGRVLATGASAASFTLDELGVYRVVAVATFQPPDATCVAVARTVAP